MEIDDVIWYTAIHPVSVILNMDVSIGKGSVIMSNAVFNLGSHIGVHCIIDAGAVVNYDNRIDDYVHISVGAKLAGTVRVGKDYVLELVRQ